MKAKKNKTGKLKKDRLPILVRVRPSLRRSVVQKAALQKNFWFMESPGYVGSTRTPTTILTQPDGVGDRIVPLKGC